MTSRGFTLIELLVAMALLSTLTAAGLASLVRARNVWQDAGVQARLHERAQYVFATLEPELQMAGFFGGALPPPALAATTIPTAALSCGLDLVRRIDIPVEVHPSFDLPCPAHGTGAMPASQLLVVRRASAQLAEPLAGRGQWWGAAAPAASGELVWNGTPVLTTPAPEPRDLLLRVYYVARAADGDTATPALRMKSLSAIAGIPAFIDTEVMPGVESLQAQLLPSASAPQRVRVTLQVSADHADLRASRTPRHIVATRQFTLRNAAP
ncbi:MAG: prepilin-type N-terminal cleavage/methylation domain-containing protein [Steroidobacteraceae bacterium]